MRTLPLLLVLACGTSGTDSDKNDGVDSQTDTDTDVDSDTDVDTDTDTDTDVDTDTDTDVDTDTDTGSPPTGSALPPGFETTLTDLYGCFGVFYAGDAADTVVLEFDANDLAGYAFVNSIDTVDTIDLGVEPDRLTVYVGTNVSQTLCLGGSGGTISATYTPASGTAVLSIWPHNTQQEQTEGSLVLTDVVLEAPSQADVTVTSWTFPRMEIGGLP